LLFFHPVRLLVPLLCCSSSSFRALRLEEDPSSHLRSLFLACRVSGHLLRSTGKHIAVWVFLDHERVIGPSSFTCWPCSIAEIYHAHQQPLENGLEASRQADAVKLLTREISSKTRPPGSNSSTMRSCGLCSARSVSWSWCWLDSFEV